ncbi:MAG: class I SAM-dependent DNA methyltransferase, partial [Dysgonamonadaceae bacterium]|nr:class I SAM-dependent DNA methyltransferase [Dysgonamonadaceae bacterium]
MANIKSAKQALNPAFLKLKPERKEIELFKKEFIALLDRINEKESEEFHKNLMIEFLNSVYYKDKHYINTKGRADLVIHNGNNADSPVGVLIEVKSPANRSEMVSKENLNVKSFQELVLYYLRERKTGKNFELRYLIITNIYEWFVFDAQDFEKLFYQNKNLLKLFEQFEAGKLSGTNTDFFYREIAAPIIVRHCGLDPQSPISYTHFDIRDYETVLRNADKGDDKKLIALYKFLSPVHLLKLPFANDSNQLNREFYAELLHILGLEEIKHDNRKLIVRKKPQERDAGSIIENAIEMIDATDRLDNIDAEQFGANREERLFNVALDLAITWINRILFLKLLEAQIIKYHSGNKNYAFLSTNKLNDYDDLNSLFFFILARTEDKRKGELKAKFAHVPYLNSSLFEKTETEDKTIFINNLNDNIKIKPYAKTVLRDVAPTIRPLEYLLRFLDAYDFSSEGSEDIQEENKSLISSSVLGLIFEKINGYKDGSFFTPSFITMYMCRETISQAVLQKFNDYFRHCGL